MAKEKPLTPKMRRFIDAYLVSWNGTQAAIKAGYSAKTADRAASRLLKDPRISSRVHTTLNKSQQTTKVRLEDILTELRHLCFGRIDNILSWQGDTITLKPSDKLPDSVLACVQSVEQVRQADGSILLKVRLFSKVRAIQTLVRIFELVEFGHRLAELEKEAGLR